MTLSKRVSCPKHSVSWPQNCKALVAEYQNFGQGGFQNPCLTYSGFFVPCFFLLVFFSFSYEISAPYREVGLALFDSQRIQQGYQVWWQQRRFQKCHNHIPHVVFLLRFYVFVHTWVVNSLNHVIDVIFHPSLTKSSLNSRELLCMVSNQEMPYWKHKHKIISLRRSKLTHYD